MDRGRKLAGLGFLAGFGGTLVLIALVGLAVVYTGAYNIAATEEHASVTRWAFDTTFRNSVESRAPDLVPPDEFTDSMIAAGATLYKASCQHCHAGPGVGRAEWASGMRPQPPHLTEAAAEWDLPEIFWLARHGAKMTGMPAFGPTHDDATLWNVAAFVKRLPAMEPETYARLGEAQNGDGGGHQHGEAEGGHAR